MDLQIDYIDEQIITLLRLDARMTIKNLAEKIGTRRSTIYSHLRKLEEKSIISGYTLIPNFKEIRGYLTAYIMTTISHTQDYKEISREIASIPQVTEVHAITGEFDLLLKVRVQNLEKIWETVFYNLKQIKGVDKVHTIPVFHSLKEELSNEQIDFQSL